MKFMKQAGYKCGVYAAGITAAWSLMLLFSAVSLKADEGRALLLELDGIIGPATSDFLIRGIRRAEEENAQLLIIRMNTPGGLDTSMREIIKHILASPVPVVSYVSPAGSRAASAGTYMMYASHVAAMAPATNLGAATPVKLSPGGLGTPKPPESKDKEDKEKEKKDDAVEGGAMERKIVNDAVAYIRGLAKLYGRNAEWAEKAVREGVSLTAEDALDEGVIDLIAKDVDDLLKQLDGRKVIVDEKTLTLHTTGMMIETLEPDWRNRLLAVITNPNVAYILMLLGIYGLFFELSNPGSIFPGVVGGICILLALYAFHVLPVDYAGVALHGCRAVRAEFRDSGDRRCGCVRDRLDDSHRHRDRGVSNIHAADRCCCDFYRLIRIRTCILGNQTTQ